MFNFQFQNQTFVNNYQQNIPQIPNQMPLYFQQQVPNNNQEDVPSFEEYLQESNRFSEQSIATSSRNTYNHSIKTYERVMTFFRRDPYPITVEQLKVFITFQSKQGITLNTLMSYITGLYNYFRSNDLPNLTLTNEFKKFKSGVQRSYKEESSLFAKLTFKPEFFH